MEEKKELLKFINSQSKTQFELKKIDAITSLLFMQKNIIIFPESFNLLQNLKSLFIIDGPHIEEIPEVLPLSLENLCIRSNIFLVPYFIEKFQNLTSLTLGNQISELPLSFGKLKNLVSLNLNFNKIHIIPEVIFELFNLETLSLSNNLISELPQNICKLKKLSFLVLSFNKFTKFPNIIIKLNLSWLWLDNNEIDEIPDIFSSEKIGNLKSLFLKNNKITNIPENIKKENFLNFSC